MANKYRIIGRNSKMYVWDMHGAYVLGENIDFLWDEEKYDIDKVIADCEQYFGERFYNVAA